MPDTPSFTAASDDVLNPLLPEAQAEVGADIDAVPARKRPRPGERRVQILQTLASMLEQPGAERITTAALAARIGVSEAALYRHFASKAQMFEGLIEFIEQTVFSLAKQLIDREAAGDADPRTLGRRQATRVMYLLVQFAEKNPGMVRVMCGDALVLEHERLQQRMNQLFDRLESTLRQCLRPLAEALGSPTPTVDAQVRAAALTAFLQGRLQRYARSGFKRLPSEQLDGTLDLLLAA
ncbi:nucleoid occlusion factor SlmA [Curvibacter sp. RS43]|jgi:TetR/AcrR family transcriptional regulator|uniref:Nucleoid occlusion factor SlmA n=1 Tax=Curvibacter microcysteis TaxID=3026419 RepID=A0ABT5MA37_9BURK|nr:MULTISPECIES: nucleoid occlusion factor SlmA [unclassified Curvibacter]MDD0811452.1 nucleoid occlusion factor SlmA [Curvibacter sp. RS43]MDD0813447.1 nucleoid occlusion factor SlmA [Curvibacter sp. HBC28]